MSAVTYESLALSWQPKNKRDKPFIAFTLFVFVLFVGLGIYSNTIDIPKDDQRVKVVVLDRIAKFILDKPKPKITKKPKAKPKAKPKPKPKPKAKPKVKRQKPKKEMVLTKKQQKSRKKAAESGLLALSEELSDLMDTSSIDSMVGNAIKASSGTTTIATVNTDILSAGNTKGSGGVNADKHLSQTGGTTTLDADQRAMARELLTARASSTSGKPKKSDAKGATGEKGKKPRTGNYRSEEDIAYIVDKNKSKLHALYRRARRSNPGIKGKIVLEITILPSGRVENVRITSSELNDAKLETRIIARVKQFDFGAKNVKKVTVTYPIEFLPS